MAAAREEIARTEVEIQTLEQQRLVEIGERLGEDRRQLESLSSQIRAAEDLLERSRLRAPQAGLVVEINTVTPGAVIGSGVPLMEIVPDGDRLVAETRLPPEAIDTVHVGTPAEVRLTAYKRSTAPVVGGEVIYVSADLLEEERDGSTYFNARVSLDPAALAALHDVQPTAGMPVEVAIRTGERRAGDYFLEPILRHLRRALREE
jgi:HlyD family secretion protein